jgi:hypothetical protein
MYLALDQDNKVDLADINGTYPQKAPNFVWPSDSFCLLELGVYG